MVKCGKCKKIFDYDKYYGICPKCGAYNRKNISSGQPQLQKENDKGSYMAESPLQRQNNQSIPMEESPTQKQAADGGGRVFPVEADVQLSGMEYTKVKQPQFCSPNPPAEGENRKPGTENPPGNDNRVTDAYAENQTNPADPANQMNPINPGNPAFPPDSGSTVNPSYPGYQTGRINPGNPADPVSQANPISRANCGNASLPCGSQRPAYRAPMPRYQLTEGTYPMQRRANSPGTVALFVCLIVGIAMTILVPVGYIIGKAVMISTGPADNLNGIISEAQKEAGKQQPQKADTVTVKPKKEFRVGKQKSQTLRADRAYVLLPAGLIREFPAGEKLVAVETSYQNDDSKKDHYFRSINVLYAGFGENTYKEAVAPNYLSSFPDVVGDRKVIDATGMSYGEGSGVILFFVPEDAKEIQVYFESRDEDTNEMLEIYEVSLDIDAGEGEK